MKVKHLVVLMPLFLTGCPLGDYFPIEKEGRIYIDDEKICVLYDPSRKLEFFIYFNDDRPDDATTQIIGADYLGGCVEKKYFAGDLNYRLRYFLTDNKSNREHYTLSFKFSSSKKSVRISSLLKNGNSTGFFYYK